MDMVNGVLNWVGTTAMVASLLLFYPPYYLFKTCYSFLSWLFPEDLTGKVVLITGASSGIGEQLAYQYALKRASLALVARRESSLQQVADRALELGARDVIVLPGDVSAPDDCNRFVQTAISHYDRCAELIYLVLQDINFWGSVQTTFAALPHLKRSRGRIVVTASATGWNPVPRMSFYNVGNFFFHPLRQQDFISACWDFETLPVSCTELGSQVGITVVTPGWIESEMSKGKYLKEHGEVEVDQEMCDAQIGLFPVEYDKNCAKAMVQAAQQGERYLTVPAWFRAMYLWRVFAPEVVEICYRLLYMHGHGARQADTASRTMAESGGKQLLYPTSLRSEEIKSD
ncbi:11-beta-hydroxysteroid dehydrogenase 1A-like isoform X3 [Miscanthus floridulus]|uniref:11-beta-hydroxysteroid dehydrogenase 1A-like isoform X3 n=1 Tax=Miscanthus floridulus TaxID=154761 RepID=UPI00345A3323